MVSLSVLSSPTPDQIHQIISLYRYEGWWSEEADDPERVSGIVTGSHLFIIALNEDEIVGMGRSISDRTSDAYIQDVAVLKEFQGKGVGEKIIQKLIALLKENHVDWIGLIAQPGTSSFYKKLGFEPLKDHIPLKFKI